MIKTNELRIGNYVSVDKGFEMLVHSIYKDDTLYLDFIPPLVNEADVWEEDVKDVSPIELTEEWLLKFGFTKHNMEGYEVHFKYNHPKLHSGITALYNANFSIKLDDVARGVKYVHQLQNLYFALTGNELNIKQ